MTFDEKRTYGNIRVHEEFPSRIFKQEASAIDQLDLQ